MEVSLLDVAFSALGVLMDPERLFYLGFGTLIGLALGIMPGVGGVAGLALLLPFTFNLELYTTTSKIPRLRFSGVTFPSILSSPGRI